MLQAKVASLQPRSRDGDVSSRLADAAPVTPRTVEPSIREILGVLAMQFYAVTWNLGTLRAKYRPSGLPSAVGSLPPGAL